MLVLARCLVTLVSDALYITLYELLSQHMQICARVRITMSPVSVRAASTDFVNFGVSVGRSLATLVYALVNSRIDYCNTVLAGAATACAECCCGSCRCLGQILHDALELHLLDVPYRVFFKLSVSVHRCLNGRAPPYLTDYCMHGALHPGLRCRHSAPYLRSAVIYSQYRTRFRLNT